MTEYVISGIWFDKKAEHQNSISHFMLHEVNKDIIFFPGKKVNMKSLLKLLCSEFNLIHAVEWNYKNGSWSRGEIITNKVIKAGMLMDNKHNTRPQNKLNNLLDMDFFCK